MSIVKKWEETLLAVAFPGSWYCSGNVSAPELTINGSSLQYPISSERFEELKSLATKAPFGKNSETILDDAVRKGYQIESSLISFNKSEEWTTKLGLISQELKFAFQRLHVSVKFYKMLLYEEGGHFAPHKDTLRDKTHIASLLISLPVEGGCEGGVLRVSRPGGPDETIEWRGYQSKQDDDDDDDAEDSRDAAKWCSFYTDCQHELTKVTKGRRVVLAYEVFSNEDSVYPPFSAHIRNAASIADVVECALSKRNLVLILTQHMYPTCCEPKHLKGIDRFVFEYLTSKYTDECSVAMIGLEVKVTHHFVDCEPFADFELSLDGQGEWGTSHFISTRSYEYTKHCQRRMVEKDPIQYAKRRQPRSRTSGATKVSSSSAARKRKQPVEEQPVRSSARLRNKTEANEEQKRVEHLDEIRTMWESLIRQTVPEVNHAITSSSGSSSSAANHEADNHEEEKEEEKEEEEKSEKDEENDHHDSENGESSSVENDDDDEEDEEDEDEEDEDELLYESDIDQEPAPPLQTAYFDSPTSVFLFNTDYFRDIDPYFYMQGGYTGNYGEPEELKYKFFVIGVTNLINSSSSEDHITVAL